MHTLLRYCLLLCFALPFSALQAMAAPPAPCSMQASAVHDMQGLRGMSSMHDMLPMLSMRATQDMQQMPSSAHDCCADHQQHSKQCGKTGQQCHSSSLLLMTLNSTPAPPLSRPLLMVSSIERPVVQNANGVWRPPRV